MKLKAVALLHVPPQVSMCFPLNFHIPLNLFTLEVLLMWNSKMLKSY